MPRQARLDSPGTLHYVIVRGIEKKDIVDNKYDRKNMVSRLGELAEEPKTNVYAWALMSEKDGVSVEALKGVSRRGQLPGLRVHLAKNLVENYGLPMAETARQLGVTTSAISRIFERNR